MIIGETNEWGETLLGVYVTQVGSLEERWQVYSLAKWDIHRKAYGQEFQLSRGTSTRLVAGEFTREALAGLRDMLTEVLGDGS